MIRFEDLTDREIDALVAKAIGREKGTGICLCGRCESCEVCNPDLYPPRYSTDIAAAWEVVEKFHEYDFKVCRIGDKWLALFESLVNVIGSGEAETAPRAICYAALKAKGVVK